MPTLYDLSEAYLRVQDLTLEGEDFETALADLGEELDQKVINIAKLIRGLEFDAEAFEREAKRLSQRSETVERRVERLKDYILQNLLVAKRDEVRGDTLVVKVQDSNPSAEISDPNKLPDPYITWRMDVPLDELEGDVRELLDPFVKKIRPRRSKILDALKADEEVPGAHIKRGKHIRIR